MTEAQLQEAVVALARLQGWLAYHTHDSRHSAAGFPDLVLVRGDRVLYRELKDARRRVTPEQQEWLDALDAAGQDVDVWRPEHWTSGLIESCLARPAAGRPALRVLR